VGTRLTPVRRFGGEAAELFYGFVVSLHRGGAFGLFDGIAALLAEAFDGFHTPERTATRGANGRVTDADVHRVRVQLRELTQRDPTAAGHRQPEFQCVHL